MKSSFSSKIGRTVISTVILSIIGVLLFFETVQYLITEDLLYKELQVEAAEKASTIGSDLRESIWFINTRVQTNIMKSFLTQKKVLGVRVYGTITPEAIYGYVNSSDGTVKKSYGDPRRQDYLEAIAPVTYEGSVIGTVKVFLTKESITNSLDRYLSWAIWRMIILSILSATILVILLQKLLLAPLAKIHEATDRVRQGDYDHRIDYTVNNELGSIVGAFNKMTINLSDSIKMLHKKADENNELMSDLQKEMQNLDKATQAKDRFLSKVEHEFRTPMHSIMSFTKMLSPKTPEDKFNKYKKQIERSGNYLLQLIDGIIDLTQIEAKSDQHEKFSFSKLCHDTVEIYSGCVKSDLIEITLDYDSRLPSEFVGDPRRLKQLLNSMLNNSIKFTNHGSIHLEVKQLLRALDSTRLLITVTDTGTGIHPDALANIFPPEGHENDDSIPSHDGPGLGLSVLKKALRYLNGTIQVSSELNQGTKFEVTLDIENCEQLAEKTKNIEDSIAAGNLNILIVEDDSTNQLILEEFFSDLVVKYHIVENGQEAVDEIKNKDYDVVLMDIEMPVMDGFSATKCIRESGNSIPIIAVSAHIQKEHIAHAHDAGCNDFISKPINFERLKEMINNLV